MKHEQKSAELDKFLEHEIKKLEHDASKTREDSEPRDLVWDAAAAAVEHGVAESLSEAANAVINSDAFAHLTEAPAVAAVARRAAEVEAPEGMVGDFLPDSAIAIEFDDGDRDAGDDADEGYMFSAVSSESAASEEEGDLFGGGGGKPPDDDANKDRGTREPKKTKAKGKDKDKKSEAKAKPKKAPRKPAGGKPKP